MQIPPANCRLLFNGRDLLDDAVIPSLHIQSHEFVVVLQYPKAGPPSRLSVDGSTFPSVMFGETDGLPDADFPSITDFPSIAEQSDLFASQTLVDPLFELGSNDLFEASYRTSPDPQGRSIDRNASLLYPDGRIIIPITNLGLEQFTESERRKIADLQAFGPFDQDQVVQVFLACDKNETVAANCLLENRN
jgi:hypothetical protein